MKLFVTISLIFLTNSLFAGRIDSLNSDIDVVKFISELALKDYNPEIYTITIKKEDQFLKDFQCDDIISKWQIKGWQKIDFNRDGLTDLFAIINIKYQDDTSSFYNFFAVVDDGNGSYLVHEISTYSHFCYAANLINMEEQPAILFRHYKTEYTVDSIIGNDTSLTYDPQYRYVAVTDTLIYKFGGFVELNRKPNFQKVKSIAFETGVCFGECPIFKITIQDNRFANFKAADYNDKTGDFSTIISENKWKEILDLVSYLNVHSLDNNYFFPVTDVPTCKLLITFFDGTKKEISDYGEQGTFGLTRLYQLFFDLRSSESWK